MSHAAYISYIDKSLVPKIKKFLESCGFDFPKPSLIIFKKYVDSKFKK